MQVSFSNLPWGNQKAIPLARIIGQRNVLAHEYGEILVERIWVAATKSIPELLESLKPLISEE